MKSVNRTATLLGSALFSILATGLPAQDRGTQPECRAIAISVSLKSGERFQQRINHLTFKVKPLKSTGWMFSLEDAGGRDFIYPVNPPLRFNRLQTLGAGYGDTTKRSLSYGRELHFLLNESDYDAFEPYLRHALWPYYAPDPDRATEQYLGELDRLRTGLLRLKIVRSDVTESDEVRSAQLKVEFIAPVAFPYPSAFSPHPVACPEATLPIGERLPARIPPADPAKYRRIQDASDWRNPFLTITGEGFDLIFQGGRKHGPLSILARTVVGLPNSAWPYGRILAAAETGPRAVGSSELIRKNKEEAERILSELGVSVDWWPSA